MINYENIEINKLEENTRLLKEFGWQYDAEKNNPFTSKGSVSSRQRRIILNKINKDENVFDNEKLNLLKYGMFSSNKEYADLKNKLYP